MTKIDYINNNIYKKVLIFQQEFNKYYKIED